MAGSKRLIVGLGNPGEDYEYSRHNVGFEVVDHLATTLNIKLKRKGEMLIGWGTWRGFSLGLLMPETFMNTRVTIQEQSMPHCKRLILPATVYLHM